MGQASSSSVRRVPRDMSAARRYAEDLGIGRQGVFKPIVSDSRGNLIARDESGMVLFDTTAFEQITAFEFAMQFPPYLVFHLDNAVLDPHKPGLPAFMRLLKQYINSVIGPRRSLTAVLGVSGVFTTAKRRELLDGDRRFPEKQTFNPGKPTSFDKSDARFKTWIEVVEEAWANKTEKRALLNDIKNHLWEFFPTNNFYTDLRLWTAADPPTLAKLVKGPRVDATCEYCFRYFYVEPALGLRDADGLPIEFEDRDLESGPYRSLPRLVANAPVNERVALNDPGFLAFLENPRDETSHIPPHPLHTDPMMNYLRYVKERLIPYAADKPNIRVPLVNPYMIYRRQSQESIESSKRPDLELATEGVRHALGREQDGFEPTVVAPESAGTSRRMLHASNLPARQWSLWTAQPTVLASLPTAGLGDSYFGRRRIMSRTKFVRLYKRLKGVNSDVASKKYDACMRLL